MVDNVANIRNAFAAFAKGDTTTLMKVFAPGIIWHEPGQSSVSGDYEGIEATLGFFGQLLARSGDTFKAELLECGEIAPDLFRAPSGCRAFSNSHTAPSRRSRDPQVTC